MKREHRVQSYNILFFFLRRRRKKKINILGVVYQTQRSLGKMKALSLLTKLGDSHKLYERKEELKKKSGKNITICLFMKKKKGKKKIATSWKLSRYFSPNYLHLEPQVNLFCRVNIYIILPEAKNTLLKMPHVFVSLFYHL